MNPGVDVYNKIWYKHKAYYAQVSILALYRLGVIFSKYIEEHGGDEHHCACHDTHQHHHQRIAPSEQLAKRRIVAFAQIHSSRTLVNLVDALVDHCTKCQYLKSHCDDE